MSKPQTIIKFPAQRPVAEAESLLWNRVRNRRIHGVVFHPPEHPDTEVINYYAPGVKLVVEVDLATDPASAVSGAHHNRDRYLNSMGLMVLRFSAQQVLACTDWVLERIEYEVAARIRLTV